ncbi:MAG TPA: DUF2066 domain-containing protein [Stellaceae bacterium]|nr:DUF2066 domain-containing protein [Stellaceae bacterium]
MKPLPTSLLLAALALARAVPALGFSTLHPTMPADVIDNSDSYQANDIVTGFGVEQRQAGFAHCLREVLVRLSGEPRLEHDPRVASLAVHADSLVASFDYGDVLLGMGFPVHDDQGTADRPEYLVTRFDHAKIEQVLADLGEQPWRDLRPEVVPVLVVHGPSRAYLLSAEVPFGEGQRDSLATVGIQYGLHARVPTEAELAAWGVTVDGFPSPRVEAGDERALVEGTLDFDETRSSWVGSWRMRWRGAEHTWGISGVNFDEAFRSLMRGVLRVAAGHGAPD